MKYRVGSRVRTKRAHEINNDETSYVSQMKPYCDRVATIVNVVDTNSYHIDIDDGEWVWCSGTLEPAGLELGL